MDLKMAVDRIVAAMILGGFRRPRAALSVALGPGWSYRCTLSWGRLWERSIEFDGPTGDGVVTIAMTWISGATDPLTLGG